MKTLEEYKTLLWHKYLQSGNREILHRYLHSLAVVKKSEELIDRFSLPVDREKTVSYTHLCYNIIHYNRPLPIGAEDLDMREFIAAVAEKMCIRDRYR